METSEKPAEILTGMPENPRLESATATKTSEPTAGGAATSTGVAAATPSWPELPEDHPLSSFLAALPPLLDEAAHSEVWGLELTRDGDFHTKLVLQKFLRANANDLDKAKEQLLKTLKWRKEFDPLKARDEVFEKKRFEGLGYVTRVARAEGNDIDVVTWNIYGSVKDYKLTFEDLDGFLRWRVALMELGLAQLNLPNATQPIPDHGTGPDPYQCIQVHDYLSVSFLRMDPRAKAASKKTIETLGSFYPEMLSRKFFVNVPAIMGWMFAAIKLFVAKETTRKFTVLTQGKELVGELGEDVPEAYGGKGGKLEEKGETPKYKVD